MGACIPSYRKLCIVIYRLQEYNEVTIYDLVKQCETEECVSKVAEYGIRSLPAIAVDGQLLTCCQKSGITKEDLINAGITEKL